VEAEIFQRHAAVAANPLMRALWVRETAKMHDFENQTLHQFDEIVAVSDRDAALFRRDYGVERCTVIPTGVDLYYLSYEPPAAEPVGGGAGYVEARFSFRAAAAVFAEACGRAAGTLQSSTQRKMEST
jgi:hypothetical protein